MAQWRQIGDAYLATLSGFTLKADPDGNDRVGPKISDFIGTLHSLTSPVEAPFIPSSTEYRHVIPIKQSLITNKEDS